MNGNILFDFLQLSHHVIINMKTSCCIQDYNIKFILCRMLDCCFGNVHRFDLIYHGKYFHALLLTTDERS